MATHFIKNAKDIATKLQPPISVNNKEIIQVHAFREEALKYIDFALDQERDPLKRQALQDLAAENLYSDGYEYSILDYSPAGTEKSMNRAKGYKPSKEIMDKIKKNEYELISWR